MRTEATLAIIAIGRNEGERLERCLRSLPCTARRIYVDSGSTDNSVTIARAQGVEVVILPPNTPFTAALARNAGLAEVGDVAFVQVLDGDCELAPGWLDAAIAELRSSPGLGAVFGRRRERYPERSVYNRLCNDEWNVPVGEASSCGGDVLFQRAMLDEVCGYTPGLIAGEEPDMCLRARAKGWMIRRIDVEMTLHDAAMTRFGQWWRRMERSGHAFAELTSRHGAAADPFWRREVRSMTGWGLALPLTILLGAVLVGWWMLAALLIYPVQIMRIARRTMRTRRHDARFSLAIGGFTMLGKVAQMKGAARYHWRKLIGRRSSLIEYKGPKATQS